MALDFPSNPSDGQIFGSYSWSQSKGVWQSREESATVAIMSPTKPLSANNGDIWVNTNDGTAFAYYDDGSSTQWIELVNSAIPTAEINMPTATIVQTARSTAPTGWLLCQGQLVSRSTYAQLFLAIGTTYGSGDGATTFALPNLQGRVPVGQTSSGTFNTLGSVGGTETHTLTVDQMPSHTHIQNAHNHTQNSHNHTQNSHNHIISVDSTQLRYLNTTAAVGSGMGGLAGIAGGSDNLRATSTTATNQATTATNQSTTATNQNTGGGQAHNNLQPYIVLNYMIKV